jgi:D-lactate dehydrogenase
VTALAATIASIVGRRHVLTGEAATRPYATGYRFGGGPVALVARPGSLVEMWRVLKACVAADHIVIVQAANTGLTGGSTPDGDYDRPVAIISTMRIDGIHLLRGGRQSVCLAGSTLYALEAKLAPLGREPHSVIGSSCIGASVVGGVCNNSGGALVQRGPAYTEYALFARIGEDGAVTLHNHLGIALGEAPEAMLAALDRGRIDDAAITDDARAGSAKDYAQRVRDLTADTPARHNADPDRLFEASGSAGRIVVFAVRLDTFPTEANTATFYIGTNDPAELSALRAAMLAGNTPLPILGEYIHRDAFDLAATHGKDVYLAIRLLGTTRLPMLYAARRRLDGAARALGIRAPLSDLLLQGAARLWPNHLPRRLPEWRDAYEHHLIVKVGGDAVETTRALLAERFPSNTGAAFECDAEEAEAALLHRFAVAAAAVRYRAVNADTVEDIIAIDVALRRNDADWVEAIEPDLRASLLPPLYYGHFFCHVFHQDYLVRKGGDPAAIEHRLLAALDRRGARYPAEHNVGHLYAAPPALAAHYRALDPCNALNPGIGKTAKRRHWQDA